MSMPHALKQLAISYFEQGRIQESAELLQKLCLGASLDGEVWLYAGLIHGKTGNLPAMQQCLNKAARLTPNDTRIHYWYSRILLYQNRTSEAISMLEQATRITPDSAFIWNSYGNLHEAHGNRQNAIYAYERAITLDPNDHTGYTNLANLLAYIGLYGRSKELFYLAYERNPNNIRAALGHLLLLPVIYSSCADIQKSRNRYNRGLQQLNAETGKFLHNPSIINDLQWPYNFYLAYQGHNDKELQREYGKFFSKMVNASVTATPQTINPGLQAKARKRIRVGFPSHFFHAHTISYYFSPWIQSLDKSQFETYIYHINPSPDGITQILAKKCDHYRPISGAIELIAKTILEDKPDILIYPEIGMYTKHAWLAALRLAPTQCVAWGHPVTTGLETVDYFISARLMEPMNYKEHYTETPVLLGGIGSNFEIMKTDTLCKHQTLELPKARTLYLCPQSLFKIHPDMDNLVSGILKRDHNALILFFENSTEPVTCQFKSRLTTHLKREGLDFEQTIMLLPRMPHDRYLEVNQMADVMLDTPHWSGGRTSLDAFSTGLPVITMPGDLFRSRQTYAMHTLMGTQELIAHDNESYIDLAVRIACDRTYRSELSKKIIDRRCGTVFCNNDYLDDLENFLSEAHRAHKS